MLLSQFHETILQLGKKDKHYLVAFSGGMDSHVLLKLCVLLREQIPFQLRAIHIHHGLSPHAEAWVQHCEQVCEAYDVPLTIHRLALNCQPGDSLEEIARQKRYEAIAKEMMAESVLLTAHHQDDQAETFLLQLMRGSGLKGLSAMPLIKSFATGWHARPLLSTKRVDLLAFANQNQLQWIEDESNADETWSRNYVRQQILPLLTSRWPAASAMIARSAEHCREAVVMQDEQIAARGLDVTGSQSYTLSVSKLKKLSYPEQKHVLREWIQRQGYVLPSIKKLMSIMTNVFDAALDKQPEVIFGAACVRRYRDDLYILPYRESEACQDEMFWDLRESLLLPCGQQLIASQARGQGLKVTIDQVSIRYRQGGEQIYLPGRGHRSLKKMFHEWGVLPWERAQVPLVFFEDSLIAIPGYYYHPEWVAGATEVGLQVAVI